MYKHQKLIEDNVVDVTALPESLQHMIARFNDQLYDLEDEEEALRDAEYKELKSKLKSLDHSLYHFIKEIIDREPRHELSGKDLKRAILKAFVDEGFLRPTAEELKKEGYELKSTIKMEERVDQYVLVKRKFESSFRILQE